jgi:hypothetical protein
LPQSKPRAGDKDVIGDSSPETAVPGPEGGDGVSEAGRVVVRPEDVLEHQLGIGRLPQEEVGQPLLAGRPDDQIRGWEPGGREAAREDRLRDGRGIQAPLGGGLRQPACGVRDVRLPAIVKGDLQEEPVIAGGSPLGLVQQGDQVR